MKKILILCLLSIIIYKITYVKKEQVIIPRDSIRLRVLANSNEKKDQDIKIKASIEAHNIVNSLLKNVKTKEEATNVIKNNLPTINKKIKDKLYDIGYTGTYSLTYGNNFFPEKKYQGIIYDKGYYDSILITLGKGEGKNWWCVLFPPLCLMESQKEHVGQKEYKFFIKEIINKYF